MAILKGILSKMKGSVGQLTFKQSSIGTVVSEKPTSVKNARTPAQQRQRMKWVNMVRHYSGIAPLLSMGFEKKAPGVTDYNMFVKVNASNIPVYMSKTLADAGACIAAPYQLTQGTVTSINVSGTGADSKTNIALASLAITAQTTVAEFSNAVVLNNPEFNYGEKISFFDITQKMNDETQVPYCVFKAYNVVLDKENQAKLWDVAGKAGFASVDGFLGFGGDSSHGGGCFAWVHSVKKNGKTKVSTQYLIDNNPLLEEYITEEAYDKAVKSYGGSNTVFLSPERQSETGSTGGGSQDTENSGTPGGGGSGSTGGSSSDSGSQGSGGSDSGSEEEGGGLGA